MQHPAAFVALTPAFVVNGLSVWLLDLDFKSGLESGCRAAPDSLCCPYVRLWSMRP